MNGVYKVSLSNQRAITIGLPCVRNEWYDRTRAVEGLLAKSSSMKEEILGLVEKKISDVNTEVSSQLDRVQNLMSRLIEATHKQRNRLKQ